MMADDLNEKISRIKDEHAAAAVERQGEEFAEKARMDAAFLLGRIWQNETIADAIYTNLASQSILALERFQEQKYYLALGFETFDQLLDKHPMSKLKKSQYYERRALIKKHGPEIYDLLTSVGIGVRSQKLLGTGELAIEGDKLVIGDREVAVGDSSVVKDVLNELFDAKRDLEKKVESQAKKLEEKDKIIAQGDIDIEQLQRNIDAMNASNPHDRALAVAVLDVLRLVEIVGGLPDGKKAASGPHALAVINTANQQLRKAYGVKFEFTETATVSDNILDEIAAQVNEEVEDDD